MKLSPPNNHILQLQNAVKRPVTEEKVLTTLYYAVTPHSSKFCSKYIHLEDSCWRMWPEAILGMVHDINFSYWIKFSVVNRRCGIKWFKKVKITHGCWSTHRLIIQTCIHCQEEQDDKIPPKNLKIKCFTTKCDNTIQK